MTNAIPLEDWLNEQGDNSRLVMCDCHPETLILVDMTNMYVYKYLPADNQDGARETMLEFLSKLGPSNEMRKCASNIMHNGQLDFKVTETSELAEENAKLRELVNGLTWCCEHSGCDNRCQLYDRSEPDHCRENLLKQELGIKED